MPPAFDVTVGADARHGTLARIVARAREKDAQVLAPRVRETLDRFSVRYDIEWKPQ